MALRAKKPEQVQKRLKALIFGPAGSGKTRASLEFPKAYIIDGERGTENYAKLIEAADSVVMGVKEGALDVNEVDREVGELLSVRHDYRTLVLDPFTTIFREACDVAEDQVGTDWGKNVGVANKKWKSLSNTITNLDMNVIITCHAKDEYKKLPGRKERELIGQTYDGAKGMDYLFDLVVSLRSGGRDVPSIATVCKTRIETFPMGDEFAWSYKELKRRYEAFAGPGILEKTAGSVAMATAEQITELNSLLEVVKMGDDWLERVLSKAQVNELSQMRFDDLSKCIGLVRAKIPPSSAAPKAAKPPVARKPAEQAPLATNLQEVAPPPPNAKVEAFLAAGKPVEAAKELGASLGMTTGDKVVAPAPKAAAEPASPIPGDGPTQTTDEYDRQLQALADELEQEAVKTEPAKEAPEPIKAAVEPAAAQAAAPSDEARWAPSISHEDFVGYAMEVADAEGTVAPNEIAKRIGLHVRYLASLTNKETLNVDGWTAAQRTRRRKVILEAIRAGKLGEDGRVAK
jgi:hypothetical protein